MRPYALETLLDQCPLMNLEDLLHHLALEPLGRLFGLESHLVQGFLKLQVLLVDQYYLVFQLNQDFLEAQWLLEDPRLPGPL